MANADDLGRLAQEVANAYEERVNSINATKADTATLLDNFDSAHQEMADNQRRELAKFKSDLDASEVERKKEDQAEVRQRAIDIENLLADFDSVHQEMADNQRQELAKFKSDLDASEVGRKKEDQAEIKEREAYIEGLLADFDKAHQEMADNQRRELAKFKSDLDASEVGRKKEDQAEVRQRAIDIENLLADFDSAHQEMADNLRAELAKFKSDLDASEVGRKKEDQAEVRQRAIDIENLLADFDSVHQEMADNQRRELAKFKSDLDASEVERKKEDQAEVTQRAIDIENLLADFDSAHHEMAEKLRAELDKVKPELAAVVTSMLNEFREEREEAAAAWKGLLAGMASLREKVTITGSAEVKAAVEVATVEEAIKEEEPEEKDLEEVVAEEEKVEEEADLSDEIVGLLEDNPDGLRMVEIADILGIESWRSLIPVMRELLDDGEVRKEDSTYFIA